MPRRRDERRRVLGPYERSDNRFRIVAIDGRGGKTTHDYPTKGKALAAKRVIEDEWKLLEATTLEQAIEAYELHLVERDYKPGSVKVKLHRLRSFFPDGLRLVGRLTPAECAAAYQALRQRVIRFPGRKARPGRPHDRATPATERPIAVDTQLNTLATARAFLDWCVAKKWTSENPLAGVEGVGIRQVGKPQLTGDEARRWFRTALELAKGGDLGALGCLMALLMALRNSEVHRRLVRDVDLDATVLHVKHAKTKKSNRPRTIPEVLQPLLRALVAGRRMDSRARRGRWRRWMVR